MPDADLVVEVQTEVVPPPIEEKTKEAELPKIEPIEDLRAQFDALKSSQEAEKQGREAAQAEAARERQRATAAEAERDKVKTDLSESNVSAVDSALAAAKAEADNYQREQQTAFETGDFKAASDAGRKMAKAEARISLLEEGKANLIERKTEAPKREERQAAPPETKSQAWLRTHPQYAVPDTPLANKATAAHYAALAEGLSVDTDAYIDFCETQLGLKAKPAEKTTERQPENRTRAMPGAPVSRDDTPTGGQASPTRVTLTPGEVRAANDGTVVWNHNDPKVGAVKGTPVGNVEYARRKIAMQKEGRYGVLSDS